MGPPSMSLPNPFPSALLRPLGRNPAGSEPPSCLVVTSGPRGHHGVWACNMQGQVAVGVPPSRDPPSWENGFIISLSLQAPAWTCRTCWTRPRWMEGHGDRWGLGFRRDWLFLHLLLIWLPVSNGVALGVPSSCWNARRCTPTFSIVPWSRCGPSPSVSLNQKLRGHLLSKARLLRPVLSHFPRDPTLQRVPSPSGASLSAYKWHPTPSI